MHNYGIVSGCRMLMRDAYFTLAAAGRQLFGRTNDGSLLVCNSLPKSGTHLLYQILSELVTARGWNTIVSYRSLTGHYNSLHHISTKLRSAPTGSIVRGHLPHSLEVSNLLHSVSAKHFLIIRDPRDVVLSHARWVLNEPRMYLHKLYADSQVSDADRVEWSIRGVAPGRPIGTNVCSPGIAEEMKRWAAWLSDPSTFVVRFEDLVGARGGGTEERRLNVIADMAKHLNLTLSSSDLEARFSSGAMNPRESHTFRKGRGGRVKTWQGEMDTKLITLLEELVGRELLDLFGYTPS